jgi:hypothetical protein
MFRKPAKKTVLVQKIDRLVLPLSLKDINDDSQQALSGGGKQTWSRTKPNANQILWF